MRRPPTPLSTSFLALIGALLPGFAAAEGALASEAVVEDAPFEVIVVRGAGVSRVTGERSGVIREETLREDPRPARREPPPRRAPPAPDGGDRITIVVNGALGYAPGYPLWVGDPFFTRHRFRGHGHPRHRQVFVSGKHHPGFHHGRARPHRHGAHPGEGHGRRF